MIRPTRQSTHRIALRQRRLAALLAAACLLLSLVVPTSCVEPLTPEQKTDPRSKTLTLRIYMPGVAPGTKSGTGDVSSVDPESRIYRLQVWMFNHADPAATGDALAAIDDETAVSYSEVDFNELHNRDLGDYDSSGYYDSWNDIYEVKMVVPGYIMDRDANNMKFDFYVLANGNSISTSVTRSSKRGVLKAATFGTIGGDVFGPNAPKYGATPQIAINGNETNNGPGLPISGFFNKSKNSDATTEPYLGEPTGVDIRALKGGQTLTPEQMRQMMPIIQLERAVAKLRFAFAKPQGMDGVQITKIEIGNNQIPEQTFVFPRESNTTDFSLPTGVSYSTATTTIPIDGTPLLTSAQIRAVSDPEALTSTSTRKLTENQEKTPSQMTASEYDSFLSTNTSTQLVYLRETDKAISGKIYYRLPGDTADRDETFTMTLSETTNFHRNHYWTVYAYFKGGGLYIRPFINDWLVASESVYRSETTTKLLANEPFRRYDKDNNYDNWEQSYVLVSYGYQDVDQNVVSTPGEDDYPRYARRIYLETTSDGVDLQLNIDNPNFKFVTYDEATQKFDHSLTAGEPLRIASGTVKTYFYLVPCFAIPSDASEEEKTCRVTLTTVASNVASMRLPFNSASLPGYSEASDEIWFYYTTPGMYDNTGRLYYSNSDGQCVPVS